MYLLLRILFVTSDFIGDARSRLSHHRGPGGSYSAVREYDSFAKNYRMRTAAEIEALEIR